MWPFGGGEVQLGTREKPAKAAALLIRIGCYDVAGLGRSRRSTTHGGDGSAMWPEKMKREMRRSKEVARAGRRPAEQ